MPENDVATTAAAPPDDTPLPVRPVPVVPVGLAPDDPRVGLAAERTALAGERTYAAWVRTGLAGLVAGLAATEVLGGGRMPEWAVLAIGGALLLVAAFCFLAAVWRDLRPSRRFAGPPLPRSGATVPRPARVWLSALLVLVCALAFGGIVAARLAGLG